MPRLRVLCRPATAAGMALAGIAAREVPEGADPRPVLLDALQEVQDGVVLLEEELYDALPEETRVSLERTPGAIVIPFPSPVWAAPPPAEERVVELLRRAVGYRVRLR